MKCPKCQAEISENSKFCPECGASITPATEESTTNQPINDAKKKKIKKIIIIGISVILALVVAFVVILIINPSCMFGHRNREIIRKAPTCTEYGYVETICKDCQRTLHYEDGLSYYYLRATGHSFDKGECGTERACINCGEIVLVSHKTENAGINCIYCNKSRISTVSIPSAPITVNEYYSSGNIKRSAMITEIEEGVAYSSDDVKINFTALRTYDATNSSATVIFAWKLYASDGTVVDSGMVYSDATVAVGEKTKDSFTIHNVEDWEDYRLEITGVK